MVQLSVVVPTFNEGVHIVEFLRELEQTLGGRDYEIVVVDDNSPDGTHRKVVDHARTAPRVVPVLRTREKGLATAVIEGMRRSRGTYVVVMDSDFQHPAASVPALLDGALAADADCVVGSRYAPGGSAEAFPLARRIISWGARTLAVVGLPVVRRFKVRDPMSGFFLVRRDRVPIEALRPRGYKILLEILARSEFRRVVEVGYTFMDRRGGESKLRMKTQVDYFLHVATLAWRDRENRRLAAFSAVGASGILVNLAVIWSLMERADWGEWLHVETAGQVFLVGAALAGMVGREVAVLWNFVWNDLYTFRQERRRAHAGLFHRLVRFHLVSVWAFLGYLVVYYPIIHFRPEQYLLASLIAILASFFLNYHGNVRWTYQPRREAHEP